MEWQPMETAPRDRPILAQNDKLDELDPKKMHGRFL